MTLAGSERWITHANALFECLVAIGPLRDRRVSGAIQ